VVGTVLVRCVRPSLIVAALAAHLILISAVVETSLAEVGVRPLTKLLLHGERLQELRDFEVELVTGGDVIPLRGVVVALLVPLEAELILGLFIDDVAILLELIVADGELPVAYHAGVELLQSLLGLVRRLEADEGVRLLRRIDREHLDAFNLAKLLEDLSEDLLS